MSNSQAQLQEALEETRAALAALNLTRDTTPLDPFLEPLENYLALIEAWTDRIDLVAGAEHEVLIRRHICDGYATWLILKEKGLLESGGVLDVGSGAGLPGVLFAIFSPERRVYLCEPRKKRAVFLQEVRRRLGLKNIGVIAERIEGVKLTDCPGAKLALFRALKPEGPILEATRALLVGGGSLAFSTGAGSSALPKELVVDLVRYRLPGDTQGREIQVAAVSTTE